MAAPTWSVQPELDGQILLIRLEILANGGRLLPSTGDTTGDNVSGLRFPVDVRSSDEGLTCLRLSEVLDIQVLTFERQGERSDYGVYNMRGGKRELSIGRPLDGGSPKWPNRNPKEALVHLLGGSGLSREAVVPLVSSKATTWFGEGLRVFFLATGQLPQHVASPTELEQARALMILVDLVEP